MENYKEKALAHVRSVCELAYIITSGAANYPSTTLFHAAHLEHWLRGMNTIVIAASMVPGKLLFVRGEGKRDVVYELAKGGEEQSEEFYQAYCEIVGI